ncbi:MAG: translocation/assembly module TamB domain-containing protein [Pseudomonadota bacterium]
MAVWPLAVWAQEDDKGFLTRTLQDALSGAGRSVSIEGFRGALSAQASFDEMTIADDDGVWLTLRDVTLDWNRSALLRGRVEVKRLTAAQLDLPRLPQPQEDALPEAEAAPFSLPELPVSILLETFEIAEINLGAPLLGDSVDLTLRAAARLDDAGAFVDLTADRLDGQSGRFEIRADFRRADSLLDLDLRLNEGPAGIAARLMSLPGQPAVDMAVKGQGPLDDFTADVRIGSDGVARVTGQVVLASTPGSTDGTTDRRVTADIGGDITTLLAPRYRAFFGDDLRLSADALLAADGSVDLSRFAFDAQAAQLEGAIALNAQSWPTRIDISGRIANPGGSRILLPFGGDGTQVGDVDLQVDYDAARGDAIAASFDLSSLSFAGTEVGAADLTLNGTLRGDAGTVGAFDGAVTFDVAGIVLQDPALAQAVGSVLYGQAQIRYRAGQPTEMTALEVQAQDATLRGSARLDSLDTGLSTVLDATVSARDLTRYAALAGQALAGAAELSLEGSIVPLSGQFDLQVAGAAQDLGVGIAQADAVLAGRTVLGFAAQRDETGTSLRNLSLRNSAIDLTGEALLRTDASTAEARFRLADVETVLPQYAGAVTVEASATQDAQGWRIDAATEGPYDAALTARGRATGPAAELLFTANVPNARPFIAQVDGPVEATGRLFRAGDGWSVEAQASGPEKVSAALNGAVAPRVDLGFDARVGDVDAFAPGISGPLTASGRLQQTQNGFQLTTQATGPFDARADLSGQLTPKVDLAYVLSLPSVDPLVPQLEGPLRAEGQLTQTDAGFDLTTRAQGPLGSTAEIAGQVTPTVDVMFDVAASDVGTLVPQVDGPVAAQGRLRQSDAGFDLNTRAQGPFGASAEVAGQVLPSVDVAFDVTATNLSALAPQVAGRASARGTLRQQDSGFFVRARAAGPYEIEAQVEGLATGPDLNLGFDLSMPNVAPFSPGITGPLSAEGRLRQTARGLTINTRAEGPYAAVATVDGVATGPDANLKFTADVPNIGAVVRQLQGPLRVAGSAAKAGAGWRIDTDVAGPAGTQAAVRGTVQESGTLNLDVAGTAPLGLSQPLIAPRDLQGVARFDLAVNGPPALSSVSGTIATQGASFSAPNLRLALQDIAANLRLSGSRTDVQISGTGSNGGRVSVEGGVTLAGALPADLRVGLDNLVLIDPRLYTTALNGAVQLSGPLSGGAVIQGTVNVGETSVNVPSTGLTSIGDIPPITHIGATRPVMSTRRKAGIAETAEGGTQGGGSGGFGLNIQVNAPSRIFVRGRGLDAELGGALRLTGTTANIISAGRFDLLRGRLDVLGQRFDLREGSAQFLGSLIPFLRFVTATETQTGEVRVIVEGPANAPTVSFESTPDAPQDEVLAQFLFGRNLSEISAFQALQLANAVATLAGRGGGGVIANLREGFGLDDLDVTTTDSGATAVRAGRYISENVYTDVTAASDGDAEVSLNLDLKDNLTGKATLGSDGNSSLGIFFERDY